jgi:hypothetical protein
MRLQSMPCYCKRLSRTKHGQAHAPGFALLREPVDEYHVWCLAKAGWLDATFACFSRIGPGPWFDGLAPACLIGYLGSGTDHTDGLVAMARADRDLPGLQRPQPGWTAEGRVGGVHFGSVDWYIAGITVTDVLGLPYLGQYLSMRRIWDKRR